MYLQCTRSTYNTYVYLTELPLYTVYLNSNIAAKLLNVAVCGGIVCKARAPVQAHFGVCREPHMPYIFSCSNIHVFVILVYSYP